MSESVATQGSAAVGDCLARIRAEYLEMPGLEVTPAQAQRLWGLDEVTTTSLFSVLVDLRFLMQTRAGTYVRQSES